jgi:hypothetical protein
VDEEGLKTSKNEISKQLKALIARSLFTTTEYFRIINQENETLIKAVEVIKGWSEYKYLVME